MKLMSYSYFPQFITQLFMKKKIIELQKKSKKNLSMDVDLDFSTKFLSKTKYINGVNCLVKLES